MNLLQRTSKTIQRIELLSMSIGLFLGAVLGVAVIMLPTMLYVDSHMAFSSIQRCEPKNDALFRLFAGWRTEIWERTKDSPDDLHISIVVRQ